MQALVWINEDTWQATAAQAAECLPADAEITLLYVASTEPERVAHAARRGLLGRHPPAPAVSQTLGGISEQAANGLLADAHTRLGRAATLRFRSGRVEHEVVAAAEHMDILVMARDGDRERLGPRSLGPATRFVIDHAPCRVLLLWPDAPPELTTIPPAPTAAPPRKGNGATRPGPPG